MPPLSVGDKNLTQSNFIEFKKSNKLFVLGISDSQCKECCQSEPILHHVWQEFQDGTHFYATKKKSKITIPVVRLDAAKKYSITETEGIRMNNIPSIFVYYDGRFYEYGQHFHDPVRLLHFINRLLHPVVILKNQA